MSKLSNIRRAGFHAYRFIWIAKLMAFILSRKYLEVYWVFYEPGCHMVLCIEDAERLNKNMPVKKLRVRDMNKMSCFRTPKKTWGKIKAAK